jgi:hypothetical protein
MSTCFLVIGTPRSGTSAVAGILSAIGVDMGSSFGQPSEANPKGSFDDAQVSGFCHILCRGDYLPESPPFFGGEHRKEIRRIIQTRRGPSWGSKEWRVSFFLDVFAELAGGDVRLILTHREAARSCNSWNRHFQSLKMASVQDFSRAAEWIERAAAASLLPTLHVDFDYLIDRSEEAVVALADFANKPVTPAALSMVSPEFRRY